MRNPLLPLSVLLFLPACAEKLSDIRVEQLTCEYQAAPLAIDSANPSLSWVLTGKGEGHVQNAYQILVASCLYHHAVISLLHLLFAWLSYPAAQR